MPPLRHRTLRHLAGVLTVLGVAATSHAQSTHTHPVDRAVTIVGGVSQFDLSGTGTTGVMGIRSEYPMQRWLLLEGGLTTFRPQEQFGQTSTYVMPEVQVQVQVPTRVFRPYLGLGVGSLLSTGPRDAIRMLSAAGGFRVRIPETRVNVRGELRVRGIGESFSGAIAEWTGGLGYAF